MYDRNVVNFSAGPSVLPEEVLLRCRDELLNYNNTGMSVMEMSHRSAAFMDIYYGAKQKLRDVMGIPEDYDILFLQGGATLMFASIPMNLLVNGTADYALTGVFSTNAYNEASKYGKVSVAYNGKPSGFSVIPRQSELMLNKGAEYFYYCDNNTIYGTQWKYVPETSGYLVCDMSSDILSKPVDVSKYGLIYAGAQKNMAPAGLTVAIVKKSLLGKEMPITPTVMNYKLLSEKESMINTPPCWCIYVLSLVLDWIIEQGGVNEMKIRSEERSSLLYDYLDNSRLFHGCAEAESRSPMNVTFRTGDDNLDKEFIAEATKAGIVNVKGHRIAGGMRASLYNAMTVDGVRKLITCMKEFEKNHV